MVRLLTGNHWIPQSHPKPHLHKQLKTGLLYLTYNPFPLHDIYTSHIGYACFWQFFTVKFLELHQQGSKQAKAIIEGIYCKPLQCHLLWLRLHLHDNISVFWNTSSACRRQRFETISLLYTCKASGWQRDFVFVCLETLPFSTCSWL